MEFNSGVGICIWIDAEFNETTLLSNSIDVTHTWGIPSCRGRGGAKHSLHTKQNPQIIIRNHGSWKWIRTCWETCWGIRNHQGWYLTPWDFIKLDFKNVIFSRLFFFRNVTKVHFQRSDCEPGVDHIRLYVEHIAGLNRQCFVWM